MANGRAVRPVAGPGRLQRGPTYLTPCHGLDGCMACRSFGRHLSVVESTSVALSGPFLYVQRTFIHFLGFPSVTYVTTIESKVPYDVFKHIENPSIRACCVKANLLHGIPVKNVWGHMQLFFLIEHLYMRVSMVRLALKIEHL